MPTLPIAAALLAAGITSTPAPLGSAFISSWHRCLGTSSVTVPPLGVGDRSLCRFVAYRYPGVR